MTYIPLLLGEIIIRYSKVLLDSGAGVGGEFLYNLPNYLNYNQENDVNGIPRHAHSQPRITV